MNTVRPFPFREVWLEEEALCSSDVIGSCYVSIWPSVQLFESIPLNELAGLGGVLRASVEYARVTVIHRIVDLKVHKLAGILTSKVKCLD